MPLAISARARIVAAAAVVLAVGVTTTVAAFTDSGQVQTQLATGSLDLKFDDDQQGNPAAYAVQFSDGFDRLTPGDSVTRDLTVFNSGSLDATLALATPTVVNSAGTPVDALQDVLQLEIVDSATSDVLYSGALSGAAFSDFAIGANGTSGTGHTLAMTVTLPASATIAVAGQSLDVTLPFAATQTAA
ncbi:TasA family protein [Leifsonia sp. F6_8S_P_1B]|uniref:TasA family protein n=1 Tax=Leifsonia williamsii TaxID=3035919 RepID=A0ABT8K9V8_9MICO|nr:TasA family protein [Leifsonia williamsii]MDN4613094.1 TasA family protein [Leifsonia williamsii]